MTHDSYDPPRTRTFECVGCGRRVDDDHQPVRCPKCDGEMRDISVPRAQ
jgi:Zn finger protein HypA/HybF involved in hydrogenase expression